MLAKTDEGLGPCEEIACHVPERRGSSIHHSLLMLLRQRLYQIAAGYEDQNGSDPLLKAVLERLPKSPFDLATSRRSPGWRMPRYQSLRIARALGELYVRERDKGGVPQRVRLFGLRRGR